MSPNVAEIQANSILEAPFWPEKIKVIACRLIGSSLEVQGKGLKTGRFFERVLSTEELNAVKFSPALKRTFEGSPDNFFLAAEAKRIRYSYQFDPLFAVNVSQIDPLPHQIDAVY
ncbi:MAG TPA: hypothetical protein VNW25_04045, partial [Candidatus Sulfotelmatobacter sp.]|nr:hypothetical protein [Candidatus Sulfotelmatobacter sp.]